MDHEKRKKAIQQQLEQEQQKAMDEAVHQRQMKEEYKITGEVPEEEPNVPNFRNHLQPLHQLQFQKSPTNSTLQSLLQWMRAMMGLDLSWCLWMECSCRVTLTPTLWISSTGPSATRPKTP
ncbi:uncharacterized protein LOC121547248 isoform X2 [Coregonus clupeaformis]|uniref:uncharacterized protein LOC121547248 isoform X2 n=1 Tax=Coregonus clupeaformis TaxID=59861 RepID=UPI001BDFD964|nr:uncharacterized protein LOC121547248 isoform X2 [Coregonus clupeaformis]